MLGSSVGGCVCDYDVDVDDKGLRQSGWKEMITF
jgi:hypothetical protein